ncbi:hypothetical protein, partial [Acinetobacter baumannii]|uniref:hypothetical protein n=1 Tax=Acinetobacter baumannii TaxID=470 RepID=UPI001C0A1CB7
MAATTTENCSVLAALASGIAVLPESCPGGLGRGGAGGGKSSGLLPTYDAQGFRSAQHRSGPS